MATTKSMKIQAEIDKVKAKISEQQARLKELEQKKLEAENSEIVDIVRGMSICWMFSLHIPVRKTHKLLCTHGKAWLSLSSIRSLHCNQIRLLLESCFY